MTMRRGMVTLLLALLVLATPTAALAEPGMDSEAPVWSSMVQWLGGLGELGEWWSGVLGLGADSEVEPGAVDSTTVEEPSPPDGELGPWISPNGLSAEDPAGGVTG